MLQMPFKEPFKVEGGTSEFGYNRGTYVHAGRDLNGTGGGNTDCGYKLFPITKGEIVHTSESTQSYGKVIVHSIKGAWGERWIRYCHCNEILVKSGQVSPEVAIATLGSTGNSTACHLHIDVFKKKPTNWRMFAKDEATLNEYFEDFIAFFNKWKDNIEENMPKWFDTLLLESNLSLEREGEFRSFWEKAKKYDSEVSSLQEQVKSANEALSSRAMEVSLLTEKNQKLSDKAGEIEELLNKVRDQLSEATLEKSKAEAETERLTSEISILQERITQLEGQTPLKSYNWTTRLISLFGIFK